METCVESSVSSERCDVLLVAEDGRSGGIGRYCVDLARAMRGRASIACLCPQKCSRETWCWLADQCRVRDLRLIPIPMPPKAWVEGFHGLLAAWEATGCPIVHVNGRRANLIAGLARVRCTDFSFVTTVHGVLGLHAGRNVIYRVIDLAAGQVASSVIAVSADTGRRLAAARVPSRKLCVITNGLAVEDLIKLADRASARLSTSQSARSVRVGFLGRLSQEKGIDEFIRLAGIISAYGAGTNFLVAGDVSADHGFGERSLEPIAESRLKYLGEISDPSRVLGDVDILVIPSRNEGLPYVLLEGMAAGCAIVAYGVGGIPEVVVDRSLGYLVRPRDFGGLVTAVSRLVAQPSAARAMGAKASEHVRKRYSLDSRLPELIRAYERCNYERARRVMEVVRS